MLCQSSELELRHGLLSRIQMSITRGKKSVWRASLTLCGLEFILDIAFLGEEKWNQSAGHSRKTCRRERVREGRETVENGQPWEERQGRRGDWKDSQQLTQRMHESAEFQSPLEPERTWTEQPIKAGSDISSHVNSVFHHHIIP